MDGDGESGESPEDRSVNFCYTDVMNKSLTERYAAQPADFNLASYWEDAADARDAVIADLTQTISMQGVDQSIAKRIALNLLVLQRDYHAILGSDWDDAIAAQTRARIDSVLAPGAAEPLLKIAEERWQKAADELLTKHGL